MMGKNAPHNCGNQCQHHQSHNMNLVESPMDIKEVNAIPRVSDDVEVITVTVDAGAYNTVGPPKTGTHFPHEQTSASSAGTHYRAANGTVIRNYGQRIVTGINDNGSKVGLPI